MIHNRGTQSTHSLLIASSLALLMMANAAAAQTTTVQTTTETTTTQPPTHAATAPRIIQQTGLPAELRTTLDSKKSKPGQEVTAVTRQQVTVGTTRLPRGTILVGHVSAVMEHTAANTDGAVTVLFDQARLKGGSIIAILATMHGISLPLNPDGPAAEAGAGLGTGGYSSNAQGPGDQRSGGGILGTTAGTAAPVVNTAGSAGGGLAGDLGNPLNRARNHASDLGSSIPGVDLTAATTLESSGTISSRNRNVHLDSGTQLMLGIAAAH